MTKDTAETVEDDFEDEVPEPRFWLVWIADSPMLPERPYSEYYLDALIADFRRSVEDAAEAGEGETVEIRQCSEEDIDWARRMGGAR